MSERQKDQLGCSLALMVRNRNNTWVGIQNAMRKGKRMILKYQMSRLFQHPGN